MIASRKRFGSDSSCRSGARDGDEAEGSGAGASPRLTTFGSFTQSRRYSLFLVKRNSTLRSADSKLSCDIMPIAIALSQTPAVR